MIPPLKFVPCVCVFVYIYQIFIYLAAFLITENSVM